LAVLSLVVAACSNESDKTAGQKIEQKAEEMGNTVAEAADAATSAVKETVMPAVESATSKVEEMAEASKSAVIETVAAASETVNDAATQINETVEQGNDGSEPTEHIVKGVITQWQPLVTFAQPGDTVRFTGMTGHDTTSMEGMIPDGATTWRSKLGEEGFTVTVDKEGGYVYKCTPHITTGMVGIIVVGDRNPANLAQLEENAGNVKVGGNMVKRAIRKLKKQLNP